MESMQKILENKEGLAACYELVEKILADKIKDQNQLEKEKILISRKYKLEKLLKNADIIAYCEMHRKKDLFEMKKFLMTKPVRTMSGVANIAVMWLGENNYSCPFNCIYCPQGEQVDSDGSKVSAPKSYIGVEPTTLRAMRNKYDPYKQVSNRLKQFRIIGHTTDKCELIIMGGTFLAWGQKNYENFIKRCYDAFNEKESVSLEDAKKTNETAASRVIGLTIETRADYCKDYNINEMLRLGATRVEVGVQTTDEKLLNLTKRGHGTYENKKAFRKLREAGFKITAHWMPGLTGMYGKVDIKKEVENFEELFKNPDYRPDELKIYPTLVIQGTELYDMWKLGKYDPLTFDQTIELMIEMKKHVPKYVRIKRIMRDISEHEAEAGARTTNLRQLLHEKMNDKKIYCNCIRCREVGHKSGKPGEIELKTEEYKAGGGMEFFISFESENNMLIGFVRLRIDDSDSAKVRELHVYGKMIPLDEKSDAYQHTGYGKKLLQKAEEVAKSFSKPFVQVTSGVGVRDYYRKLGYVLKGPYMVKTL